LAGLNKGKVIQKADQPVIQFVNDPDFKKITVT
jgi:hypothetical protein